MNDALELFLPIKVVNWQHRIGINGLPELDLLQVNLDLESGCLTWGLLDV